MSTEPTNPERCARAGEILLTYGVHQMCWHEPPATILTDMLADFMHYAALKEYRPGYMSSRCKNAFRGRNRKRTGATMTSDPFHQPAKEPQMTEDRQHTPEPWQYYGIPQANGFHAIYTVHHPGCDTGKKR
jgi:hypothetical protein